MKEVKIVRFTLSRDDDKRDVGTPATEKKLTEFVNDGWNIITSGGVEAGGKWDIAFVILVRERLE